MHSAAPPPPPPELPVSVQWFKVQLYAPPPAPEVPLPVRMQLFSVPPDAPPPKLADPCVKLKPERLASSAKYTHPFDRPPSITVNSGPLILRRLSGISTTTRL